MINQISKDKCSARDWQVKVFDQFLDVLYQNLFFDDITLNFLENKAGTK